MSVVSAVIVTVQESDRPEQVLPVQPFHVAPAPGTAVTVTEVPSRKLWPAGLLLNVPAPFDFKTSLYGVLNRAVTGASELTVNVHVGERPPQAPPHPAKIPFAFLAVSVTDARPYSCCYR